MTYNWLAQFSATWDMLVSVRLPEPLRGRPKGAVDEEQLEVPELAPVEVPAEEQETPTEEVPETNEPASE